MTEGLPVSSSNSDRQQFIKFREILQIVTGTRAWRVDELARAGHAVDVGHSIVGNAALYRALRSSLVGHIEAV